MDVTDLNENFLNSLLKKINQEQKVLVLGDFNIDLMDYNEHKPKLNF